MLWNQSRWKVGAQVSPQFICFCRRGSNSAYDTSLSTPPPSIVKDFGPWWLKISLVRNNFIFALDQSKWQNVILVKTPYCPSFCVCPLSVCTWPTTSGYNLNEFVFLLCSQIKLLISHFSLYLKIFDGFFSMDFDISLVQY